jgi:hypothetical protein
MQFIFLPQNKKECNKYSSFLYSSLEQICSTIQLIVVTFHGSMKFELSKLEVSLNRRYLCSPQGCRQ